MSPRGPPTEPIPRRPRPALGGLPTRVTKVQFAKFTSLPPVPTTAVPETSIVEDRQALA